MESGALLVSTEPVAEEPTVLQLLTSKSPEKFSPASKVKEKNIKSVMGDVGSICKKGQTHIATWVPWEYRNEVGHVKCNESTMVWCLGVILTELFSLSTTVFYWDDIYLSLIHI